MGDVMRKRRFLAKALFLGGLVLLLTGCSATQNLFNWPAAYDPDDQEYALSKKEIEQYLKQVRPFEDPAHYYKEALYFQQHKKYNLAIKSFTKVVAIDPTHIKAYNGLGVTYDLMGDFRNSEAAYKEALKIDPDSDYVLNNLGYSCILKGDFDSAIEVFEKTLKLHPEKALYHNNLGLAYAKKGLHDRALAEFRKTGDQETAKANLAKILKENGTYREKQMDPGPSPEHDNSFMADNKDKPTDFINEDDKVFFDTVMDERPYRPYKPGEDRPFVRKKIPKTAIPSQSEDIKIMALGVETQPDPILQEIEDRSMPPFLGSVSGPIIETGSSTGGAPQAEARGTFVAAEPAEAHPHPSTTGRPWLPAEPGKENKGNGEDIKIMALGVETQPDPILQEIEDHSMPLFLGSVSGPIFETGSSADEFQNSVTGVSPETVGSQDTVTAVGDTRIDFEIKPPSSHSHQQVEKPSENFKMANASDKSYEISSHPISDEVFVKRDKTLSSMFPDDAKIHEGVTVEILSLEGLSYLTKNVGNDLVSKGFKVEYIKQPAKIKINETRVHYCSGFLQDAYIVAKAVPGYQNMDRFNEFSSSNLKVKIILGFDLLKSKLNHFNGHEESPKS